MGGFRVGAKICEIEKKNRKLFSYLKLSKLYWEGHQIPLTLKKRSKN